MECIEVKNAYIRISKFLNKTPILISEELNSTLKNNLYFKFEGFQKTGAFKFRGALNTMLSLKETNQIPNHVVAFSSGNHAQAVAYAAKMLGIKSNIFIPEFCSKIKIQSTRSYGAEVILTKTRAEAEEKVAELQKQGAYFIHPFDNDMVIAGQGTSCYEALYELCYAGGSQHLDSCFRRNDNTVDAIFATCGGGGWLSGSYLAKKLLSPDSKIYGCEPLQANDASQSYKNKKIIGFDTSPETIADGARTPKVSERTFKYLQKLDGFFEVPEDEIIYWTQHLTHHLKISVEPTSAVAMAGAFQWIKQNNIENKKILILLSGGNIDSETHQKIWNKNRL